jgi:hypothetical protein
MRECQRFALTRTDTAVNLGNQPQNIVVPVLHENPSLSLHDTGK